MAIFGFFNARRLLNNLSPGAGEAGLGDIAVGSALAVNELQTKFDALLAKMDTANVAGLGNNNAATFGTTEPAVPLPAGN